MLVYQQRYRNNKRLVLNLISSPVFLNCRSRESFVWQSGSGSFEPNNNFFSDSVQVYVSARTVKMTEVQSNGRQYPENSNRNVPANNTGRILNSVRNLFQWEKSIILPFFLKFSLRYISTYELKFRDQ